jgi:hypothetical protein
MANFSGIAVISTHCFHRLEVGGFPGFQRCEDFPVDSVYENV